MPHLDPILVPVIEAAGYRLVRLRLMGTKHKTLQIMAERPDGTMDVEDCATLSHALSEFLDTQPDIIEGEYSLEISSAGIDRPLTRIGDFSRWAGHDAKLELSAPLNGRKRFKGTLLGLDGAEVLFKAGPEELRLPFAAISDAKLILTDKLIEEDFKSREAAHKEH